MLIICYLAQDDRYISAVQARLALAKPPMVLVTARSLPELVNQAQTLPVHAVIADSTWPVTTWTPLVGSLRQLHPDVPILALAPGTTDLEWWNIADDLLQLDESLELFLYRLKRVSALTRNETPALEPSPSTSLATLAPNPTAGYEAPALLENPQFRHFAQIFSGIDEPALLEAFVAWAQQACQTSRVVMLLRDPETGDFVCQAHRGLPSTLVPHCAFPQTAPLCRWLAATGRVLLKENGSLYASAEVMSGLELMQAAAAVPILFDGQLVGILGVGPRLVGHSYSGYELEGLFALAGQAAVAVHNCRMHETLRVQQEMTEHVLSVMPTGTLVVGQDSRIAFVNVAAAAMVGKSRSTLLGMDLRLLPSPLGDLAYEALLRREDLPRRELEIVTTGFPVAVTGFALSTTPPSAMLLLEDLSAQKSLVQERERRVDLEVVTNLVHYLAHELRNPLVSLSTFASLAPQRATEPDFHEFCETVLQGEIGRVNLILEQLLVLTHHVEFQFSDVDLLPIIERVTSSEELHSAIALALPISLPVIRGDAHRLETAITCIMRTVARLAAPQQTPATVRIESTESAILINVEAPATAGVAPEWLLNPWDQLMTRAESDNVDLGLATAQNIFEEHHGSLTVSVADQIFLIYCRLPVHAGDADREGGRHDTAESARR